MSAKEEEDDDDDGNASNLDKGMVFGQLSTLLPRETQRETLFSTLL